MSQRRLQLVEDRFAQSGGHAAGHNLHNAAQGVPGLAGSATAASVTGASSGPRNTGGPGPLSDPRPWRARQCRPTHAGRQNGHAPGGPGFSWRSRPRPRARLFPGPRSVRRRDDRGCRCISENSSSPHGRAGRFRPDCRSRVSAGLHWRYKRQWACLSYGLRTRRKAGARGPASPRVCGRALAGFAQVQLAPECPPRTALQPGQPSSTPPRPGPWDSPNVVRRRTRPKVLPAMVTPRPRSCR